MGARTSLYSQRLFSAAILLVSVAAAIYCPISIDAAPSVKRSRLHRLTSAFASYGADNHLLVIGSSGGGFTLWDDRTHDEGRELAPGSFWGYGFALSKDGVRFYYPGSRGLLECYDLKAKNPVSTGLERNAKCNVVAVDHENRYLATGTMGAIELWRLDGGVFHRRLMAQPVCGVVSLDFSPDNRFLDTSSIPPPDEETVGGVALWRLSDGVKLFETKRGAWAVAFAANGKELISRSDDQVVSSLDVDTGHVIWSRQGRDASAMSISEASGTMAIGTKDGWVELWDQPHHRRLQRLRASEATIVAVAIDGSGSQISCVDSEEQVTRWRF